MKKATLSYQTETEVLETRAVKETTSGIQRSDR